jgi:acyl carrier protein
MAEELNVAVLESMLIEMFEVTLEIDGVNRESHFFACGGDSLSALELVHRLISRLNVDIDPAELPLWSNVSSIAEFLQDMLTKASRQNLG